jgi:translation initiation factor 1
MSNHRLVYSTESGRICPACARPAAQCTCRKRPANEASPRPLPTDGIVRIRRETQGRKGKIVTVIHGLLLTGDGLEELARLIKQHCGSGGTIQEGTLVIQGDHRQRIRELLEKKGYSVKLAGG